MKLFTFRGLAIITPLLLPLAAAAQTNTNGSNVNAIPTEVPFLTISPDSRSGAMGDAGVAISPDANANFWNPAKLTFNENNDEFYVSYSPWMRNFVADMNLSYISFAHRVDSRNSIGASLRYF